jgi:hypothetical protein
MIDIYLLIIGLCFLIFGWFATTGVKSQFVRLVDVFIYGPILVYSAMLLKNRFLQIALLFIGTTTISYNLRNYLFQK